MMEIQIVHTSGLENLLYSLVCSILLYPCTLWDIYVHKRIFDRCFIVHNILWLIMISDLLIMLVIDSTNILELYSQYNILDNFLIDIFLVIFNIVMFGAYSSYFVLRDMSKIKVNNRALVRERLAWATVLTIVLHLGVYLWCWPIFKFLFEFL